LAKEVGAGKSRQKIELEMLKIRQEHKDYGCLRMTGELRNRGCLANKKKVQRLLKKLDIRVTSFTRRTRKYNSYKGTVGRVAKNRIRRRFDTNMVHQKITTDTTEFKCFEPDDKGSVVIRKLYLNPFMDMFNGEIISYHISEQPTNTAIMLALEKAIEVTKDCCYRRTFHSDQGWAYQHEKYVRKLRDNKIFQSMSRKGNCLDNAVMENFFGILKQEMYYGEVYRSYTKLQQAIEDYIVYYNNNRMKKKLNWMSPVQYREKHQKIGVA